MNCRLEGNAQSENATADLFRVPSLIRTFEDPIAICVLTPSIQLLTFDVNVLCAILQSP